MQVFHPHHFRRALSQPAVHLMHSGIDFHEIHARQMHRLPVGIHCPVDVDAGSLRIVHGIVGITVGKTEQHEIRRFFRSVVQSVLRQTSSLERQLVRLNPLREIRLAMILVLGQIPFAPLLSIQRMYCASSSCVFGSAFGL